MLDATGKPSSGILDGNVQFFGDYDECVNLGSDTAHYCIVATPLASAKYPYKLIVIILLIHLYDGSFKAFFQVPLLQWGFCVNSTTDNDTIGNAVFDCKAPLSADYFFIWQLFSLSSAQKRIFGSN